VPVLGRQRIVAEHEADRVWNSGLARSTADFASRGSRAMIRKPPFCRNNQCTTSGSHSRSEVRQPARHRFGARSPQVGAVTAGELVMIENIQTVADYYKVSMADLL